ncbi:MAG: PAS domain-containing protein, partial [Verrucomicrobiota bacterium]|nr:PAS domain-containing protein [Verrucomicrobiota bacterium]
MIPRVDAPQNEWSSVPNLNRSPSASNPHANVGHGTYEAIIDQAPVGILLLDAHLRFQHVNPKAAPVFGDVGPLVGRELIEILRFQWPEGIAQEVLRRFQHTLETGEPFIEKGFTGERQDRNAVEYYDWELHRLTLPDGQLGVVCYFIDIEEHIHAQEALRRSEQELR